MVVLNSSFARAFHPASIAIVGVSGSTTARRMMGNYGGFTTLCNLLDLEYPGRIYPINPNASEILGIKTYPTVCSLPEIPDLVIIAVPASLTPRALADCASAGALNVHIMTSGFGETAQAEGIRLQEELRQIATSNGIRLIGPNCMGLQVPSARMSTFEIRPQLNGPVSFVSQSGTVVHSLMRFAVHAGIGFSKLISCGNSLILDIADYVEFLSADPETSILAMYIEGVSDGHRLTNLIKRTNPLKPCIIWKVGMTDAGARAALSHTGQLGGQRHIWNAFFRQTGAIQVHSIEDLSDMLMTFLHMQPVKSNRAGIITAGGGVTVVAGDIVSEEGLSAPRLSPDIVDRLIGSISLVNQGIANPLDLPDTLFQQDLLRQVLSIVADDPNIDMLIMNWPTVGLLFPEYAERFVSDIIDIATNDIRNKPLSIANNAMAAGPEGQFNITPEAAESKQKSIMRLMQAGIPVYESLPRACRSLAGFAAYNSLVKMN